MDYAFLGEPTSLLHLHDIGTAGLLLVGRGACIEFYSLDATTTPSGVPSPPLRRVECLEPESGLIAKITSLATTAIHPNLRLIFASAGPDCHVFAVQNPSGGVKTSKGLVISRLAVFTATASILNLYALTASAEALAEKKGEEKLVPGATSPGLSPAKYTVILSMGLQTNAVESLLLTISARPKITPSKRVVTKQLAFSYEALPPRLCSSPALLYSLDMLSSLPLGTFPRFTKTTKDAEEALQECLASLLVLSGSAVRDILSWRPFGKTVLFTSSACHETFSTASTNAIVLDNGISLDERKSVNEKKFHKAPLNLKLSDVDDDEDEEGEGDLLEVNMKDHGLTLTTLLSARVEMDKVEAIATIDTNTLCPSFSSFSSFAFRSKDDENACDFIPTASALGVDSVDLNSLTRCMPFAVSSSLSTTNAEALDTLRGNSSFETTSRTVASVAHSQAAAKLQSEAYLEALTKTDSSIEACMESQTDQDKKKISEEGVILPFLPLSHTGSIHQVYILPAPVTSSSSCVKQYAISVSDDRTVGLWALAPTSIPFLPSLTEVAPLQWRIIARAGGFRARPYTITALAPISYTPNANGDGGKFFLRVAAGGEDTKIRLFSFTWNEKTLLPQTISRERGDGGESSVSIRGLGELPDAGATIWKALGVPITSTIKSGGKKASNTTEAKSSSSRLFLATASGALVKFHLSFDSSSGTTTSDISFADIGESVNDSENNMVESAMRNNMIEDRDTVRSVKGSGLDKRQKKFSPLLLSSYLRKVTAFPPSSAMSLVCGWLHYGNAGGENSRPSKLLVISSTVSLGDVIDLEALCASTTNTVKGAETYTPLGFAEVKKIEICKAPMLTVDSSLSSRYLISVVASDGLLRTFLLVLQSMTLSGAVLEAVSCCDPGAGEKDKKVNDNPRRRVCGSSVRTTIVDASSANPTFAVLYADVSGDVFLRFTMLSVISSGTSEDSSWFRLGSISSLAESVKDLEIDIMINKSGKTKKAAPRIPTTLAFLSASSQNLSSSMAPCLVFAGDSLGSVHTFLVTNNNGDFAILQRDCMSLPEVTSYSSSSTTPSRPLPVLDILPVTIPVSSSASSTSPVVVYILSKGLGVNIFTTFLPSHIYSSMPPSFNLSFVQKASTPALDHFQGEILFPGSSPASILVAGFAEAPGSRTGLFVITSTGLLSSSVITCQSVAVGGTTRPWAAVVTPDKSSTNTFSSTLVTILPSPHTSMHVETRYVQPALQQIVSPVYHARLTSQLASITLSPTSIASPTSSTSTSITPLPSSSSHFLFSASDDDTILLSSVEGPFPNPGEQEAYGAASLAPLQRFSSFPQPVKTLAVSSLTVVRETNQDDLRFSFSEIESTPSGFAFFGGGKETIGGLFLSSLSSSTSLSRSDSVVVARSLGTFTSSTRPNVSGKMWLDEEAKAAQRLEYTDVRILSLAVATLTIDQATATRQFLLATGSSAGVVSLLAYSPGLQTHSSIPLRMSQNTVRSLWSDAIVDSPILAVKLFHASSTGSAAEGRVFLAASCTKGRLVIWDVTKVIRDFTSEIPENFGTNTTAYVVMDTMLSDCAVNSLDITTSLLPSIDGTSAVSESEPKMMSHVDTLTLTAGLDSGDVVLALLHITQSSETCGQVKIHLVDASVSNRHGSSVRSVRFIPPQSGSPPGLIQILSCGYDQAISVSSVFAGLYAPLDFIIEELQTQQRKQNMADSVAKADGFQEGYIEPIPTRTKITFDTREAPYGSPLCDLTSLCLVSPTCAIAGGRGMMVINMQSICQMGDDDDN